MFKKKQAKKLIFAPKIALRTVCSETAQVQIFAPTFWMPANSVVRFSATEEILNR